MNSKFVFTIGVIVGAGIGVAGTYSYFKDKYEKLAEEDFNSRRAFEESKKDESEESVAEKTADSSRGIVEPSIAEYAAILHREGYVNYSDMPEKEKKQEVVADRPYVIQPSDFGELDDYEKISLTYTADGVLLDDMNEIVDDIEEIVGEDSLEHFGEDEDEDEDDSVYVRNDSKKCDYEILLDHRNYQEILEIQPHRTEI